MKKLEYILYSLTFLIFILVIIIKSFAWPWAGPFLIVTYTSLSMIFMSLSWLIYTTKQENQKRLFFIYGTIPLGIAISILFLMAIAKLQHWPWHEGAFKAAIILFFIVAFIFIIASKITKDNLKKIIIKELITKTFVFITITIALNYIDFDKLITALSIKK